LPEAGLPIEVNISSEIDENFGVYGADKLYPVPEKRLNYWSSEYSSSSNYSYDTQEHKIGNQSVKRILLALELLQGVTAWTTGENSIADVNFKWDLIVKVTVFISITALHYVASTSITYGFGTKWVPATS
jgi:hypothetical protein